MKKIKIIFLFFSLSLQVFSQTPTWTVFNTGNSPLPSDLVYTLAKDHSGYFWIGTADGLATFDGTTNWTIYDTTNSPLPDNFIFSIALDSLGNKWLGFLDGELVNYNGSWTVYDSTNSPLPTLQKGIYDLEIDKNGTKWMTTWGAGLFSFDGVNWNNYNTSNSPLSSDLLQRIAVDTSGNVWVGTDYGQGLHFFDGNSWAHYDTVGGQTINDVHEIFIDRNNNKWISSWQGLDGGELFKYDNANWTDYTPNNSGLTHKTIWRIDQDFNGNYWMATDTGLVWFNGSSWIIYNTNNSPIPDNRVLDVMCDGDDIWIATWNGLAVVKNGTYTGIKNDFDVSDFKIYPNPFTTQTTIMFSEEQKNTIVKISDIVGKEIKTINFTGRKLVIERAEMKDGIYFMQTLDEQKHFSNRKLIIE